jgi:hypothetical protein
VVENVLSHWQKQCLQIPRTLNARYAGSFLTNAGHLYAIAHAMKGFLFANQCKGRSSAAVIRNIK